MKRIEMKYSEFKTLRDNGTLDEFIEKKGVPTILPEAYLVNNHTGEVRTLHHKDFLEEWDWDEEESISLNESFNSADWERVSVEDFKLHEEFYRHKGLING